MTRQLEKSFLTNFFDKQVNNGGVAVNIVRGRELINHVMFLYKKGNVINRVKAVFEIIRV